MKKILIQGGQRLQGNVAVAGSTELALSMQAAALLASTGEFKLTNVADTAMVDSMSECLQKIGLGIDAVKPMHQLNVQAQAELTFDDLTTIDSSTSAALMVGPLLARTGSIKLNKDQLSDELLDGLSRLGATVSSDDQTLKVSVDQLAGSHLMIHSADCLVTQSLILAAVLANGITVIENAACDFEVIALANLLNKMGARVHGAGTKTIRIQGVTFVHGCDFEISGDHLEATALMLAAAITNGDVIVENIHAQAVQGAIDQLERMGCTVIIQQNGIRVLGTAVLLPSDPVALFPKTMRPELAVLQLLANGNSVNAKIDPKPLDQLQKMQADVQVQNDGLVLKGPCRLTGTSVKATDAVSALTLTLAGLAARGMTIVENGAYLGIEYEDLPSKLQGLGASLQLKDID
ncbi:UDP-N-acetylglucosamine 1-carboxyvinyltransferase [Limosilactobacillus mucosae]|uniref:UDP-N-acetylglucosamine 1-carboxyvinyltransferase n=1 Tax=Limosilactobacillus mucosae TaxID=97478 RepID=A0AAJ1HTX1_LIMMU|nr:UDP-N-acetylglucosamine 1-carboxyvinyltransferase [Limosilactobacillus mucosae]MDC2829434.1 UDP-N-acetylglucosamine 1-carboxyvinyltransferase [Limosilactobacillus mucosae]MDC2837117.1 UDP-N-acetylglucosamine 1-carboxyvinyltransferase [Limosilactobacillus mucosae]MDC2849332.1 UDP-N-acetylglucosamine 1-carboxyvinyltransferase [Limosilactobacillus mucosae]MDC2853029.1 UDP-N-acetylglucosamine 1-carboxyvinyltransferase [Limosilactobacillus mucosae]